MTAAVIVIAKQPIAGRVKTRLVPPLTHAQAACVAAAALSDTLRVVHAMPAPRRVLAFDGCADGWLLTGWQLAQQSAGTLDLRLADAFAAAGAGPALLVGMDTPQLRAEHLAAFDPERYDACLGLAPDGGYWALGLRDPRMSVAAIAGVAMSTNHTGVDQLDRLTGLGLRVQLLATLTDVDTIDSALEVATTIPDSSFAAAVTCAVRGATRPAVA